jgi:hypothetical protein
MDGIRVAGRGNTAISDAGLKDLIILRHATVLTLKGFPVNGSGLKELAELECRPAFRGGFRP